MLECDSRERKKHYTRGRRNVLFPLLALLKLDVPLQPLLLKNFIKTKDKTGKGYLYVKEEFPMVSDHLLDHISKTSFRNQHSNKNLNHLTNLDMFQKCGQKFHRINEAENCKSLIIDRWTIYSTLGCNRSLKFHF